MRVFSVLSVVLATLVLIFTAGISAADVTPASAAGGGRSAVSTTTAPLAELHVTPVYSGPGCCWIFELTQVWGAPGNIVQIVGQVTTPGATITSAQILCNGTISNTSTTLTAIIPNGLTPTNPPGVPSCSLRVCFSSPNSPNISITFNGYDAAGNTSPCPPCLMRDTLTVSDASCVKGCVKPPTGMVLWLPFNEPVGPIANNAAGGNNGVHVNSPTIINQYVQRGLCFNGSNQWVNVKTYPAINFGAAIVGTNKNPDFSIDAWIRREGGDQGVRVIVDKRLDSAGGVFGYSLYLFNGQLSFQLATGAITNYNSLATVPADNQWHFVAVTVKRNDPNGVVFYLDGVPVGPTFSTIPHNGSLATKAPFRVAARTASTPGTAVFLGCIDEVEVFRRVLLPSEVFTIYSAKSDGKCHQFCYLPTNSPFCVNYTQITVSAYICNYSGATQTYNYNFVGLPASIGCSVNGPTVFTPSSGSITIPTGTCATIPVIINKPTGLTCNATACYEMSFTNTATGETYFCHGSVRGTCLWCVHFPVDIYTLAANVMTPIGPISVQNTGPARGSIDYQIVVVDEDGDPAPSVRLNGLPPGEPVLGTLSVAPGQTGTLDVAADFEDDDPLQLYSILLEADLDGDGIPEPIASAALKNYIPSNEYVPGDANGDGAVDISDAVALISYIFAGGPAPDPLAAGDANCDSSVDISDAVYLIAYIFSGGPAPCTP